MLFHLQYSLNSKTTKATPRGPCLAGNSSLVSKPLSHFQVHTQEPEFFSDRSSSTKQWLTAFLGCCSVLKGVTDIGNSALIHSELSFQVFTGEASTQLSTLYSSEGTGRSSGVLSQRPEERAFKLFFSIAWTGQTLITGTLIFQKKNSRKLYSGLKEGRS